MNDERLERGIREALLRDDPGPLPQSLRYRASSVPVDLSLGPGRRARPSRLRAAVGAMAAAAVVLGSVVAVGVAIRNAAPGPAASATAAPARPSASLPATTPPSAPPSATPSPSSGIRIGGFAWTRIDAQFGGAQPGPIVAVGSGLYLFTNPLVPSPAGAAPRPALWRSSDGLAWVGLQDSPAFAGVPGRWADHVFGLAADGPGLVAVGAQLSADGAAANGEAWTSADGTTWARATVGGAADATMDRVYAVSGGFVAVGTDGYAARAPSERGIAIWTSADGRSWSRIPARDVPSGVAVTGVAQGAGRYVAVGVALPPGGSAIGPTVPIWTSADGSHYARLQSAGAPPASANILDVAWTGSAFVAAGVDPTVGAYLWRSADGTTWQQIELPLSARFPQVEAEGVAQASSGLVVVGSVSDAAGVTHGMVWGSGDGRTWQQLATPSDLDNIDLRHVSTIGGRVFVEGRDTSSGAMLLWFLQPIAQGS